MTDLPDSGPPATEVSGAATWTEQPPAGAGPEAVISAPRDPFGRLEPVQLRKFWKDEARDLTPWLAKEHNLTLLGEAIGMNLEHVATEQYIGPFRADIIAKDEDTEVIIENQLDATDHKHLGQLMVYAANRGSGVIVWVARSVTDEYRKVIDWLNEKTDVSFFALEVELWRIGDSPVAPKFNVVSQPNNFTRAAKSTGELGAAQQLQLDFWTAFTEFLSEQETSFSVPKPKGQHWYQLRFGTSRAHITLTALVNGRLGCELYIGHSESDAIYAALENEKQAIEAELGGADGLEWMPLPDKKSCRIALYKETHDLNDRDKWPASFLWLLNWAEKFKTVFANRVKAVELADPADSDAAAADGHRPEPGGEGATGLPVAPPAT